MFRFWHLYCGSILQSGADYRVIVFDLGSLSSGIPAEWSALEEAREYT